MSDAIQRAAPVISAAAARRALHGEADAPPGRGRGDRAPHQPGEDRGRAPRDRRKTAAAEKLALAAEKLASAHPASRRRTWPSSPTSWSRLPARPPSWRPRSDLLEGKRKSTLRLYEIVAHAALARELAGLPATRRAGVPSPAHERRWRRRRPCDGSAGGADGAGSLDAGGRCRPAMSRMILTAQEDLRREIARQMHDGPAQSLTNIVLQAQIVDRLMTKDPEKAQAEVGQLIAMVQRTLDATKTFIFDVRPMVLDDLGLVPTLRRASRDRGAACRRAGGLRIRGRGSATARRARERPVPDARRRPRGPRREEAGHDCRCTSTGASDWSIELTAGKHPMAVPDPELPPEGAELPPALAEMVEERRRAYHEAVEAARIASLSRLPRAGLARGCRAAPGSSASTPRCSTTAPGCTSRSTSRPRQRTPSPSPPRRPRS